MINFNSPGIPDGAFARQAGIPMTKQEIRAIALAKLQLSPGLTVYDIGAGTGSVAIECQRLVGPGRVYAIESNPNALELIKLNIRRFNVELQIIAGTAPAVLDPLPEADRIFIGGSGGEIESMVMGCDRKLKPGGILVMNTITLYTPLLAHQVLEGLGYDIEAVQVNIAVNVKTGNSRIWQARNPVTIISAKKGARP